MRSNYKPIGQFVRQVKARNSDLSVTSLKGISINKEFMPSVANVNGTDLSKYRVVRKGQFAFNPMHVGRDEVLPIGLLQSEESVIVSPAYVVFEIVDPKELIPEYLMMWCRRSEFDRNAWFTTDSSVRGGFSWSDFCELALPVPSPDKQREIVKEYHTIVDRIALNGTLCNKLEEAAQALYRHWFEEFEFPISKEYAQKIGKPELEGMPYRSSGGEISCENLGEIEIPKAWESKPVYDTAKFINGSSFSLPDFLDGSQGLPIIKIAELKSGIGAKTNYASPEGKERFVIANGDVLYSWSGTPETSLEVFRWHRGKALLNQHIFKICLDTRQSAEFVYYTLKHLKPTLVKLAEGKQTTGLGHITVADLKQLFIPYPAKTDLEGFISQASPFYYLCSNIEEETIRLERLLETLLSKLAKIT